MIRPLILSLGVTFLFLLFGNCVLVDDNDRSVDHTIHTVEKIPDVSVNSDLEIKNKPVLPEGDKQFQHVADSIKLQMKALQEQNELKKLYIEALDHEIAATKARNELNKNMVRKERTLISISFEILKEEPGYGAAEILRSKNKVGYFKTVIGDYIYPKHALDSDGSPVENTYSVVNPFDEKYEFIKVDRKNGKVIYINLVEGFYPDSNPDSNILRIDIKIEKLNKEDFINELETASTSYITLPTITPESDGFKDTIYIDENYSLLISAEIAN